MIVLLSIKSSRGAAIPRSSAWRRPCSSSFPLSLPAPDSQHNRAHPVRVVSLPLPLSRLEAAPEFEPSASTLYEHHRKGVGGSGRGMGPTYAWAGSGAGSLGGGRGGARTAEACLEERIGAAVAKVCGFAFCPKHGATWVGWKHRRYDVYLPYLDDLVNFAACARGSEKRLNTATLSAVSDRCEYSVAARYPISRCQVLSKKMLTGWATREQVQGWGIDTNTQMMRLAAYRSMCRKNTWGIFVYVRGAGEGGTARPWPVP